MKFTASEFRKALGLSVKHFSNEEISKIISSYARLRLEGCLYRYWTPETGWATVSLIGSIIDFIQTDPERSGGGYPDTVYQVSPNMGALILFQTLKYHKLALFKKSFYKLPGAAQNLYRAVSPFQSVHLTAEEMSRVLGTSGRLRIKRTKAILKILKDNGFIRKWEPVGVGSKTVFHIWRYFPKKLASLPAQTPEQKEQESKAILDEISSPQVGTNSSPQVGTLSRGKKGDI